MEAAKVKAKPVVDPEDPALVLTFADLDRIGKICHKNLSTYEDLVVAVEQLNTVSVSGHKVTLEPRLLTRLKSRCLDKERFPQWLSEVVIKQLHDYAGW